MNRPLMRVIVVAVSTAVTLLAAEAAARAVFRCRHDYSFRDSLLYVADPLLDYRINPSYQPMRAGSYLGWLMPSSDGIPILALGGSMTWGHGNSGPYTWPSQVEAAFNQGPALETSPIAVINGGTSGYGSTQIRLRMEREAPAIDPAVIIVDATWNGVGSVADARAWLPENIAGRHSGPWRQLTAWLSGHSLLAAKTRLLRNSPGQLPSLAPVAALFETDLRAVAQLAQQHRWEVIFLQAPALWRFSGDAQERDLLERLLPGQAAYWRQARENQRLARNIIARVAQEAGMPVLDGAELFEPLSPLERVQLFSDYMHLSDKGNALLAQGLLAPCQDAISAMSARSARAAIARKPVDGE